MDEDNHIKLSHPNNRKSAQLENALKSLMCYPTLSPFTKRGPRTHAGNYSGDRARGGAGGRNKSHNGGE